VRENRGRCVQGGQSRWHGPPDRPQISKCQRGIRGVLL
jgi:hypothetical protein